MPPATGPRADRPRIPGYGIAEVAGGGGLLPWSWAVERLVASHNYWLSSMSPGGAPHAMPVWGIWLDDRLLFTTGDQSRKARNLALDPRCVVTTEYAAEAVVVEGLAGREGDPALISRFVAIYDAKYKWKTEVTGEPLWVVEPRVAFGFIEAADQFTATATRWTFARAIGPGARNPRR